MDERRLHPKSISKIYEKNTVEINGIVADILAFCCAAIIVMVILSAVGFFEFGTVYTAFLLAAGLFFCLMPKFFIRFLPDNFMKYYMIISAALFIGVMGANKNIGIYITYILIPLLSCLYFDPLFVIKSSAVSYLVMIVSVYISSAAMPEVLYQGYSRNHIFLAYAAGFTIEYVVTAVLLYYLVKRVNCLILECSDTKHELDNAEKEKQILNALCINYTAAYCCDLLKDYIEPIKVQRYAHSAGAKDKMDNPNSYSEWIQYSFENILHKETSPDYLEQFKAENIMHRLQTEESFTYRHRTVPNRAGMEYFEVTVVRLYEDKNSFKIIMGYRPVDAIIAEEQKHQEELENALRKVERANAAKTDFLHRMSHDIRTPLNGIIGLLEVDQAHYDNLELVEENHQKMMIAANHLLSLINDVLQMSKLEDGTIQLAHERISMMDMARDIVLIVLDRAVQAGIEWNYEKDQSEILYPYVYGSPLHLRQIFLNIYGNCIKYNRPGGKITTTVTTQKGQDGMCIYRWTITDTGIGMSGEFLKHIFDPFSQEKNDARSVYQGTGLGMSIVKKLIDKMGGTISVTSEVGTGSSFVITIPFEIAPSPEKQPEREHLKDDDIHGLNLLLAEDNALNAEIAETLLGDRGVHITTVENGQLAVEQFRNHAPGTFDAILMDIMMPVMDGFEATQAIRAMQRPDAKTIPVIAMTANAFDDDVQKCMDAGMNAHLTKPLAMKKVTEIIAQCCKYS